MKNLIHFAVAGVIAAAIMVLLKLLLSQQPSLAAYHYPAFDLAGQEGLKKLGIFALFGAAYAVAYGLLLKALLPGGLLFGSLALGAVPTLVSALVLPMYHNEAAIRDPWTLLWLYVHWTVYSLCLVFIAGGKGGGKKNSDD
ncbi:MAG TPA: hypothetical protein VNZ54_02695 [bacterium]|jgi:hypothetical protein|nr:hypothetical protein [bacterium]